MKIAAISLRFVTLKLVECSQSYDDHKLNNHERPQYTSLYSYAVGIWKESNRSMKKFASTY